ncbi:MAG: pilin [Nevskiales bacterium]
MKQFFAMLAAIAIALFAYELYRKPQVEEAQRQAEALKQQTEQLAQRAETLKREAEAQRQAADEEHAQYAAAQAEAMRQQAEQSKAEQEALRQQAQELSRQATVMKEEVDAQRAYAEKERAHYQSAAYLAEGLNASANAKAVITEYYQSNGEWPNSNEDVGLPAPGEFSGRALRSMAVTSGGTIRLTYNEKTGVRGGTIELIPDASQPEIGVKWRCESSSYSNITITIPQCIYRRPS